MFTNAYEQSIYAVIAACALPVILSAIAKLSGGFTLEDNRNPRQFLANASGLSARAHAAEKNGFESLPIFIASIFFATYLIVPQQVINQLAWYFILIRIMYSVAYLLDKPMLRSVLWYLSMACPLMLFKLSIEV